MQRAPDDVRFWSKVDRSDPDGCWPWIAKTRSMGYGYFHWQGQQRPAHRVSWQLLRGEIPANADLDHLCRNRVCVNPAHLEPVTHHVNVLRGEGFSGKNARKTHCPQGHEYSPENTIVRTKGDGKSTWTSRECRICTREGNTRRVQAFRARQRAAG